MKGFAVGILLPKQPGVVGGPQIGGGEAVPTVMNAYKLGKLIGAPYVPITPYVVPFPLPVRLELRYGKPLRFEGTGNEDDEVIADYVEQVKSAIRGLLDDGLAYRAARRAGGRDNP